MEEIPLRGWNSAPVPRDLWDSFVNPVQEDTREILPTVAHFHPVYLANVLDTQTAVIQIQVLNLFSKMCNVDLYFQSEVTAAPAKKSLE